MRSGEPWLGPLPVSGISAAAQGTYARTTWVDAAKGVGIVLVVIGHVIGGLRDAGLVPAEGNAGKVLYLIYTFHMPLFFMLSGLFVESRLAKSRSDFVGAALTRVGWPYILWSVVQLSVVSALGALVNHPAPFSAERYVALAWLPVSPFWFLHALLLMLLVSYWVVPRWGPKALLGTGAVSAALARSGRTRRRFASDVLVFPILRARRRTRTRAHRDKAY